MRPTFPNCSRFSIAALTAASAMCLTGCADDNAKITSKVGFELEACKKSTSPTFDIKFEGGRTYTLFSFACKNGVSDIAISEQINATAKVTPYTFNLRKDTSDGRWHITGVVWGAYDQSKSILEMDNIDDNDIVTAIKLLGEVETSAPSYDDAKVNRLKLYLMQRKRTNKQKESITERAGLGVAQPYYDKALAASTSNANLAARLRLEAIGYLDKFRVLAVDASTPNENAAEWELAAIKSVRKDAEDAKKKGDNAKFEKLMAEIAEREKEAEQNAVTRVKDAETMTKLAAELLKRECAEIQSALTIAGVDTTLSSTISGYKSSAGCP